MVHGIKLCSYVYVVMHILIGVYMYVVVGMFAL